MNGKFKIGDVVMFGYEIWTVRGYSLGDFGLDKKAWQVDFEGPNGNSRSIFCSQLERHT